MNEICKNLASLNLPVSICGKATKPEEFLWMCETCTVKKVETCIPCYCSNCFKMELHNGHKYYYDLGSDNATCDCGDELWLSPSTFCELHKKKGNMIDLESMLPIYNREITPIVLQELQRIIQKILIEPKQENKRFDYIMLIVEELKDLINVSICFCKMVSESFIITFPDLMTTHYCEVNDVLKVNDEIELHSCHCNVIENLVKFLVRLGKNKIFSDFVAEMSRLSPQFAEAIFSAFWKNYCFLFADTAIEEERSQIIYKMLWQSSIEPAIPRKYVPLNFKNFIQCVKFTAERVILKKDIFAVKFCYFLMYDFYTFLNNEHYMGTFFIENQEFFLGFIQAITNIEFSNNLGYENNPYDAMDIHQNILSSCEYLQRIFAFMIRDYNMKNVETNKHVFTAFKECIKYTQNLHPNIEKLNTFVSPLLRCFSYFLNKFLVITLNYQDEGANIFTMMGISKEEFISIALIALKQAIRVQIFILEIDANFWPFYGSSLKSANNFLFGLYKPLFASADIALIQNILYLMSPSKVNLVDVFGLLEDYSTEEWKKKTGDDMKKAQDLRERKWFLLMVVLFNTDCRLECYMNSLKEEESLKNLISFAQLTKKEIIRNLLQEEDKHGTIEHIDIQENLRSFCSFLKSQEVEKVLTLFLDKNTKKEYQLGPNALKYYDFASFLRVGNIVNSEINMRGLIKKQNLKEFNMLQAPPRLKIDSQILYGILANIDMDALIKAMKQTLTDIKDLDQVSIYFLKFAYECVIENNIKNQELIEIVKQLKFVEKIYMNTVSILLNNKPAAEVLSEKMEERKLKESQAKMLNFFRQKMESFAGKNKEELKSLEVDTIKQNKENIDEICGICKEKLNNEKGYGRMCTISEGNRLFQKIFESALKNYEIACCYMSEQLNLFIQVSSTLWKPGKFIISCGHYMHLDCFSRNQTTFCPICKKPTSLILPNVNSNIMIDNSILQLVLSMLFEREVKDVKDPKIFNKVFKYVCNYIILGAGSMLNECIRRKLIDIKYLIGLLQACSKEKPSLALVEPHKSKKFKFQKSHLNSLLMLYLKKDKIEDFDKQIRNSLEISLQWCFLKHYVSITKQFSSHDIKSGIEIIKQSKNYLEDTLAIMKEMCLLLAAINNWDDEQTTKLINIVESENIQAQITGLQKLILPLFKDNIIETALTNLNLTQKLLYHNEANDISNILEIIVDSNKKCGIFEYFLGVTICKVGLISNLPESFIAFQIKYISQVCPGCEKNSKEKLICLICGKMVCLEKGCKNNQNLHTATCNSDSAIYLHSYYGNIIINWQGQYKDSNDSLYKNPSQKNVNNYTKISRVICSKELEEYTLNKEAYNKWNTLFVTGNIFFSAMHNADNIGY